MYLFIYQTKTNWCGLDPNLEKQKKQGRVVHSVISANPGQLPWQLIGFDQSYLVISGDQDWNNLTQMTVVWKCLSQVLLV